MSDSFTTLDLGGGERCFLERLRAGSQEAFEELIDQYQDPIYRFVYGLLNDPSEAGDVTQEVFVKVFRNIGRFREDSSLKTWIYSIAVNEASNRRRWFSRHRLKELAVADLRDEDAPRWDLFVEPGESPYFRLYRKEQRAIINRCLREIPEKFRVALVLRDFQGLTYQEIAGTLGISMGTVKSRILRGREALREKLLRRLPLEAPQGMSLQAESEV